MTWSIAIGGASGLVGKALQGTDLLARTIATLDRPPNVFIHASAVGFYGDETLRAIVGEGLEPPRTRLVLTQSVR